MAENETPAEAVAPEATPEVLPEAVQEAAPEVAAEAAPKVAKKKGTSKAAPDIPASDRLVTRQDNGGPELEDDENHPDGRLMTFGKIKLRVR